MKNIISIFSIITLTLGSCVEKVNLDMPSEMETLLVVEGGITNAEGPHEIRLSTSSPFNTDATAFNAGEVITDAKVIVVNLTTFNDHEFLQKDIPGIYLSDEDYKGRIGHEYYLKVEWNNNVYHSSVEKIEEVPPIDSLYVELITGTENLGLYIDMTEGSEPDQYYRWVWDGYYQLLTRPPTVPDTFDCCNVCYAPQKSKEIKLLEDRLINGNQIKKHLVTEVSINEPTGPTDYLITVKQQRISENHYNFWLAIDDQNKSEGGLFDTMPERVVGNMKNINKENEFELGYFSASGESNSDIMIYRARYSSDNMFYGQDIPDCRLVNVAATLIPPLNWN